MTKYIVMKTIGDIPDVFMDTSRLFVALGDEQRQRILLTFEPGERLNIGRIVSVSTLSRTAVSHHLKALRPCGALQSEKIGKEVYFRINKKVISGILQRVLDYINAQA